MAEAAAAEAADRDPFSFDAAEHQSGRQLGSSNLASGASLRKAKRSCSCARASSRLRASLSFASAARAAADAAAAPTGLEAADVAA